MTGISEEEFLLRLKDLDDETLYFISRYARARRRSVSKQAWITTSIATTAGVALIASYLFPLAKLDVITLLSALAGAGIAFASFMQQRRSEEKLIHKLLRNAETYSQSGYTSEKKLKLIEEIMKAGGLQ